VSFETIMVDTIPVERQRTPNVSERKVILYLHGGGFISYSPRTHRRLSSEIGRVTSSIVFSVDYRLAPEHPYPAAIDDAFEVYKWLINEGYDPSNIVNAGDSAGGYLTLMVLLRIRDEGIQVPKAAVCISPATDLTATHDALYDNVRTDISLAPSGVYWMLKSFLGDTDSHDGAVSPLFADLKGLPPLLFQVSKIEMLYSDSVRFVEKAKAEGVDATLQSWDDTVHVFQWFNLPETKEAMEKIGIFVREK
jgi:monoterpene epsilon-lactone hydrolase